MESGGKEEETGEGGRAKMALHKDAWTMHREANGSRQLLLKHAVAKTPASFLPSDPVCPSPPPSTRGSLISRIEE